MKGWIVVHSPANYCFVKRRRSLSATIAVKSTAGRISQLPPMRTLGWFDIS
jgi:hypothetical protein